MFSTDPFLRPPDHSAEPAERVPCHELWIDEVDGFADTTPGGLNADAAR